MTKTGRPADSIEANPDRRTDVELFREVLAERQRRLGEAHPDTLSAMSELAATLTQYDEDDETGGLAKAASPKWAAACAGRFVDMYRKWGGEKGDERLAAAKEDHWKTKLSENGERHPPAETGR